MIPLSYRIPTTHYITVGQIFFFNCVSYCIYASSISRHWGIDFKYTQEEHSFSLGFPSRGHCIQSLACRQFFKIHGISSQCYINYWGHITYSPAGLIESLKNERKTTLTTFPEKYSNFQLIPPSSFMFLQV